MSKKGGFPPHKTDPISHSEVVTTVIAQMSGAKVTEERRLQDVLSTAEVKLRACQPVSSLTRVPDLIVTLLGFGPS